MRLPGRPTDRRVSANSLLPERGEAPIWVGDLSALAIEKDLGGLRGSANEVPVARGDTSVIMPFRRIGIVAPSGFPFLR